MEPAHLRNDLRQELFLIICEMEEEKLIELFNTGRIRFYLVRIILNLIKSTTSPFYFKFRKVNFELEERHLETPVEVCDREEIIAKTNKAVDSLYWYDGEVMRLYAQEGTIRKVAEITKIPFTSIHSTIQKARKLIKQNLND